MKEIAELFKTMCVGEYSGHMSMIRHNPTIHAIFLAAGYHYDSDMQFAQILRKFADELDGTAKSLIPITDDGIPF